MIQKTYFMNQERVWCRLTFALPESIWADAIYLVGDFNGWSQDSHPMRQNGSGQWVMSLEMEAGPTYEFRYLCDGEWMNDNQADSYSLNLYGTHNFLVFTDPDVGLAEIMGLNG